MAPNPAYRSTLIALVARHARRLLEDPEALMRLAGRGENKAAGATSGPLAGVVGELKALLRLIRAYARGDYRKVSWKAMAVAVGAVLYVVSPIDVIPDFVLGPGHLDDASVLAFAYRKIHKEVEEFLEWERATGAGPEERASGAG